MGEVKTAKKRIGWIDIAKAICIICVILGHHGVEKLGFVYSFHLTVFFLLSGYTLKPKPIDNDYLKNKFSRLMAPYFVTSFFVTVMNIVNSFLLYDDYSVNTAAHNLYVGVIRTFFASGDGNMMGDVDMYYPIGAIWFLPAMFFALLFVQIIVNKIKSEKLQMLMGIAVAGCGAMSMNYVHLPFSIQAGMFAVPFILLGNLIKKHDILEKLKFYHYLLMFGVYCLGCHLGYAQEFYMVKCYAKDYLFTIVCAICSSFVIIGISRLIKNCKPLEFIGRNSLIVLCVHLFELDTFYWHFQHTISALGLKDYSAIYFSLEIPLVLIVSTIIVYLNKLKVPNIKALKMNDNRDYALDIVRLIAILSMVLCTFPIEGELVKLLYVINFTTLIMVSGYSFVSGTIKNKLLDAFCTLIPYGVFGIGYILVNHIDNVAELKTVLLGLSRIDSIMQTSTPLGIVALLLPLFLIKFVYIFIDKIGNQLFKHSLVLVMFTAGIMLGINGIYLPWSIDVALVGLGLYHIANCMRRGDILNICKSSPYVYFPLSMIFIFELLESPINFEWRGYFNVGLMILGSISLFIILYNMSCYVIKKIPNFLIALFSYLSRCSIYVLAFNVLLGSRLTEYISNNLNISSDYVLSLVLVLIIEITVCAIALAPFVAIDSKIIRKRLNS